MLFSVGVFRSLDSVEEMIKDPTQTLSGVCDFLGIPFDPQMASLEGGDRSAIYEADHHAGVREQYDWGWERKRPRRGSAARFQR